MSMNFRKLLCGDILPREGIPGRDCPCDTVNPPRRRIQGFKENLSDGLIIRIP